MISWMTEVMLPWGAVVAFTICLIGMAWKLGRYGWLHRTMKKEIRPRPNTPHPATTNSWLKALLTVNVYSYTRFWMRANPATFAGHVLYHTGLFIGMGTYGVALILIGKKLIHMPPYQAMQMVFDWFQFREQIFGTTGAMALFGQMMYVAFVGALVIAVIGIATPLVMSLLKMRGMIRPLDNVFKAAGITHTDGLTTRTLMGYQRKAIGLIVLVMDAAMLSTFLTPVTTEVAYVIHVGFALALVASLPFTFLFHEIYRVRMWSEVARIREGRFA